MQQQQARKAAGLGTRCHRQQQLQGNAGLQLAA